ncbi:hypothetical protein RYA07_27800 [Pseudomonas syringae pv. actinidiae]|uniref:Acetate kinase n=3 Tax=Pseudomonas syringae TaxID=317 RepID=A0A2V0QUE6_PSESF|nr:hypothetical protein [Pseudomonas syringae]AQL35678.1 hypothetical protein JN853_03780 [Pseudomonas syringae pv. actinidiae ICMP 9853]MDG6387723.1 hypothetical protein [Pseudomonas syringae]MDU8492086.1 hypothetical protein [Pseudomonas syringae pv. actinidiae]BBI45348.1 hypothetical protein KPSA1B_104101 [Pseudomonas syringae pv. actinidiae]GBH13855.1 Acetate kinase [Pseudomonas syringae pv. actinidiae]
MILHGSPPAKHSELTHQCVGDGRVYYSDVALAEHEPGWHLLLEVAPSYLTIYPINPRAEHPEYGQPRYHGIRSIIITRPVYTPYSHPATPYEVDELLDGLPEGLYTDWRYGLGFKYEYRCIVQALSSLKGVDTIVIHGGTGHNDAKLKGNEFYLGVDRLEQLRKSLVTLPPRNVSLNPVPGLSI